MMNSELSREDQVDANEEEVITFWEEMPKFPGGDSAMLEFINERIKYPEYEKENNIQGRVRVAFTIESDGSVTNVSTLNKKKKRRNLEMEAERVIGLLPKFSPATQQGNPVSITMTVPINFYIVDWRYKLKRFFKIFKQHGHTYGKTTI